MKIKQKGFTLIELLVVVAIIGLLASVVMVAIYNARVKGRNTKRLSDMTQMSTALELYHNANPGYPDGLNGLPLGLTPTAIAALPTAPIPADGVCGTTTNPGNPAVSANTYYYVPAGTSSVVSGTTYWSDYTYYFCLGNATGDFQAGVRTLTPKGIR